MWMCVETILSSKCYGQILKRLFLKYVSLSKLFDNSICGSEFNV